MPRLRLVERLFVRLLKGLRGGSLRLEMPSGAVAIVGDLEMPLVNLCIVDSRFFRQVISGGSVGFGEAYMDGLWTTSDLSALLLLLANNQSDSGRLHRGFSVVAQWCNRFYHLAKRNTLAQSRGNIQAHYDLSNDFYAQFLDPTMTYSSALFQSSSESLEQAQLNKIDRMLDLAGVQAGDSILEIGSGWGALAIRAAQRGCRVKTITLSDEQYALAQERFEAAGVADQIEICLQDYRTLDGQFDAVLSCEMIEAVGKEYLPSYFKTIQACLNPGAKAVIQAITISDDRYEQYCRSCDWIQKHIFPGGHLPSVAAIRKHVADAGSMSVTDVTSFGRDYAETLHRWATSYNSNVAEIKSLGFDAAFSRKWNYYLSYCESGFNAHLIDVKHVVLERT
jgi:cyclopropane-fatty-acyl-phospholipid synthase